jgi:hypothetical protein
VKPEIEIAANGQLPAEATRGTQGNNASTFVVHPPDGEALYGAGHSAVGFTAGRDGVVVYERGGALFAPVLSGAQPMSGWSHVAVVYRGGTPSLYVNGRLVKSGQRTGRTVHPGLGSPSANVRFVPLRGRRRSGATLIREALGEDRIRELAANVPDPDLPPAIEPTRRSGARVSRLAERCVRVRGRRRAAHHPRVGALCAGGRGRRMARGLSGRPRRATRDRAAQDSSRSISTTTRE